MNTAVKGIISSRGLSPQLALPPGCAQSAREEGGSEASAPGSGQNQGTGARGTVLTPNTWGSDLFPEEETKGQNGGSPHRPQMLVMIRAFTRERFCPMLPTHVLLSCVLFHSIKVTVPSGIWLREGLAPHPHPLLGWGAPGRACPLGGLF